MVLKVCASRNCYNSERNRPDLKFFSFPKSEQFARAWAEACNTPELAKRTLDQLYRLYLCAEHFEDRCFMNPKDKTELIRWKEVYSIPTLFKHDVPKQNGLVGTNPSLSLLLKQCTNSRLKKICRFCSCLKPTPSLVPIYGSYYEPLMRKLQVFGICLEKDDGLPTQICRTCAAKLLICVETLEQFSDSQRKLKMIGSTDISTLTCEQDGILEQIVQNNLNNELSQNDNCFVASTISPQEEPEQQTLENKNCHQIEEMEISEPREEIKIKMEVMDKEDNAVDFNNTQTVLKTIKQEIAGEEISATNNSNSVESLSQQPVEFIEVNKSKLRQSHQELDLKIDEKESILTLLEGDPLSDEFRTTCTHCGRIFISREFLMKHIHSEHMSEKSSSESFTKTKATQYQCKICNAMLGSSIAYLSHLKMHAAKTPGIKLSKLRTEAFPTVADKHALNLIENTEIIQPKESGRKRQKIKLLKKPVQKDFKCDNCELSFPQKAELRLHLATHQKAFTCDSCDVRFWTPEDIQEHKKIHIPLESKGYINKPFRVEIEDTTQIKPEPVKEKNISRESDESLNFEPESQREVLFVDEPTGKENGEVPVIDLDEDSNSNNRISENQDHIEDDRYECGICMFTFKGKASYELHAKTHRSLNLNFTRYICHICGYKFFSEKYFSQHLHSHANKLNYDKKVTKVFKMKDFKCNICEKEFNTKSVLMTHLKSAHSVACKECKQEFESQESLKIHTRELHRESKYICNQCGNHFTSQGSIYEHMVAHGSEKNSEKIHERLEKPLRCKTCHLTLKTMYTMKCHMDKHKGVKYPFACDKCEMKFDMCSKFEEHHRKHDPKIDFDRPYACGICDSRFLLETALKRHCLREHSTSVTSGKRKIREDI